MYKFLLFSNMHMQHARCMIYYGHTFCRYIDVFWKYSLMVLRALIYIDAEHVWLLDFLIQGPENHVVSQSMRTTLPTQHVNAHITFSWMLSTFILFKNLCMGFGLFSSTQTQHAHGMANH
jgi:hypothetical protein